MLKPRFIIPLFAINENYSSEMVGMDALEKARLKSLYKYEKRAYSEGFQVIAGVDEAGRGPLAGPVVAAACILPKNFLLEGIDDSKKLTPAKRESLYQTLTTHPQIVYAIGILDHAAIDAINIYQATIQAMLKAIEGLSLRPDLLLVDGMGLPHAEIPSWKIIEGDALSLSIAAGSIIAKVTRDRMMEEYHRQWPEYGFKQHKGYGTPAHLQALEKHGPCPIHRRSFRGCQESSIG
jgi:ribonuclease HII